MTRCSSVTCATRRSIRSVQRRRCITFPKANSPVSRVAKRKKAKRNRKFRVPSLSWSTACRNSSYQRRKSTNNGSRVFRRRWNTWDKIGKTIEVERWRDAFYRPRRANVFDENRPISTKQNRSSPHELLVQRKVNRHRLLNENTKTNHPKTKWKWRNESFISIFPSTKIRPRFSTIRCPTVSRTMTFTSFSMRETILPNSSPM